MWPDVKEPSGEWHCRVSVDCGGHAQGRGNQTLRIGVRAHDFGKLPAEELASRVAANLLSIENYREQDRVMQESFDLLGERIAVIHAQDFAVEGTAALRQLRTGGEGRGELHYPLRLGWLAKHKPGISILIRGSQRGDRNGVLGSPTQKRIGEKPDAPLQYPKLVGIKWKYQIHAFENIWTASLMEGMLWAAEALADFYYCGT